MRINLSKQIKCITAFTFLLLISFVAKAQPTITSITPLTAKPGDAVTILGSSFPGTVATTEVYFGNTRVTTYQSASTGGVRVVVPVGATYGPITVLDKVNHRVRTSKQFFSPIYAKPKGSFGAGDMTVEGNFTTGNNPNNVAVGDIDGDGKPDAVTVSVTNATFSVLRNTSVIGASNFATKVDFTTGLNPYAVAVADINNDAKLDVVVVNNGASTISVFKNTSTVGAISFDAKVDFSTGGSGANSNALAIADLDFDGWQDIVVTNGGGNAISTLLNTSTTTTISFATRVLFTASTSTRGVAIADIDGDGRMDIAATNSTGDNVSVFRNTTTFSGTLTLATRIDYSIGSSLSPMHLAFGDINNDGKLDMITANYYGSNISTLINTSISGTISFNAAVTKSAPAFAESIGIADFDSDGKLDVSMANNSSSVSVFKNTTTATSPTYATSVDFTTGSLTLAHAMGDIDGDGKIDAVAVSKFNNAIVVVRNSPAYSTNANLSALTTTAGTISPTFNVGTTSYTASVSNATTSTTVKATKQQDSATLQIQLNGGAYTALTSNVSSSTLALNLGENIINIKVTAQDGTTTQIYTLTVTRAAPPTITSISPMSGPVGTTVTLTGTFFSSTPANNIVYFGATKATVTAATTTSLTVTVPTGATYAPITVLNTTSALSGASKDYFNTTFKPNKGSIDTMDMTPATAFATNSAPYNIAIGDIDGDGKADEVVLDYSNAVFSVFRNTSTSGLVNFAPKIDFTTRANPRSVTLGDINNDGKLDVIVLHFMDSISVFRNTSTNGSISFAPKVNVLTGLAISVPTKCIIGDVNNDGKPDIIVNNTGQSQVSVLRNTSTSSTNISFAFFTNFTTGNYPASITLGDIDNDGKADIITANSSPANATGTAYYVVSVLQNMSTSSTISFAPKLDFTVDGQPSYIALADINGDGTNDIVTGNKSTNNISVLVNYSVPGVLAMNTAKNFSTGVVSTNGLAIADIDGDGKLDVAVSSVSKGVRVLRNTSTSTSVNSMTFASPVTVATAYNYQDLATGDIDGDGKTDITAIGYFSPVMVVLRNTPILSSNNNLSDLVLYTSKSLTPVFDSLTTSYTSRAFNYESSTLIKATKAQDSAKIELQINSGNYTPLASGVLSSQLNLNVGNNIINVRVTAQNGNIKIYTITVYRACLAQSSTTNLAICPSQLPFTWNTLVFTKAESKGILLSNADNCDSLALLNLTIKANSTSNVSRVACDSLVFNGITFKSSGTYVVKIANSVGCDSSITLTLTIKKSTTSWTDVLTCDSTFWNGTWYSKSGFYTKHFTNKAGCDSAASLNLTVNDKPTGSFASSSGDICAGDSSVISFNIPYTTNRQFLHVYNPLDTIFEIGTASFGADTRTTPINSNIIAYLPNTSSSNQACSTIIPAGSFTGKVALIDRGTCTFAAKAKAAQDDGAIGVIIVNNVAGGAMAMGGTDPTITIPVISISQADGQLIKNWINAGQNVNGFSVVHTPTYLWSTGATSNNIVAKPTQTTIYNVTVSYENGCSQKFYYALLVRQKSTSTTNITTCDSTIWNGTTYKTSGTYTYKTLNAKGCDSTATLNLTINKPTSSWTDIATCDSALWNGVWYKQNGQYTVHLTNSKGCDSAALLNLTITPKPNAGTITGNNSFCFIGGSTTLSTNGNIGGVWSSSNSNRVSVTSGGKVTASMGGNYTIFYTVTNACGASTASFNIKVNVPSSTTLAVSACGSYTWNGNTYTTSGIYTKTGMTNVGGCDSTASLDLTIKNPTTSITNLSVCDSVIWNGVKYKTSGSYIIHKTNAVGCDSALTLNLTVKKATASTTNLSVCDSTVWNGITYKTTGLYIIHKTNAAGCDSALTLNLTVKKATTSTTTMSVCDSVIWNNTTYKTSGVYTFKTVNATGCDSTATLNLTIKKATSSIVLLNICESELPYTVNGLTFVEEGKQSVKLTNAIGCDSVVTYVLSTTSNGIFNNVTITQPKCDSLFGSVSATYFPSIRRYRGTIDSTDQTQTGRLNVTAQPTSSCSLSSVNPGLLSGDNKQRFYESYTLTNTTGATACFSVNLTNYNSSNSYTIAAYNGSFNPANPSQNYLAHLGSRLALGNAYFYFSVPANTTFVIVVANYFTGSFSGDYILEISGLEASEFSINNGLSWQNSSNFNAVPIGNSNLLMRSNNTHCTTTYINNPIAINAKASTSSNTNISICSSALPYTWNGLTFTTSGSQTKTGLINSQGCDSTATLNLTIIPKPVAGVISGNSSFCSNTGSTSLTTNGSTGGIWFSNSSNISVNSNGLVSGAISGNYIVYYVVTNTCGADTAKKDITVNPAKVSVKFITACNNYTWNGTTYTTSGTYTTDGFFTTNGCDSSAAVSLTINYSTTSNQNITICSNQLPYVWNGLTFTNAGSKTKTGLINSRGCDSSATLNLTIKNASTSTTNLAVCDSTIWNNTTYKASGVYTFKTLNSVGCDSTATLNLIIKKTTTSTTNIAVCDSTVWNNTTYKSSGVYTFKTLNALGCDSIATLNLTIKKTTTSTTTLTVCDSIIWNNTTYKASGVYTFKTLNALGCDSTATLNLTIKKTTTSTTNLAVCDSTIWNNTTYKTSGVYTFKTLNAVGCDSIATLNLTIKNATTSTTTLTVCDSIIWNNTTYKTSGVYTFKTLNALGCDSTAILNLTINTKLFSTINKTICQGQIFAGYNTAGVYKDTLISSVGCDSIRTINLTILAASNSLTSLSICSNELPYVWNGLTFTNTSSQTAHLVNSVGCDSAATLNLTVNNGILGNIIHPTKGGIKNVKIRLTGSVNDSTIISNNYSFGCQNQINSVTIRPTKNNDINKSNGITATDVLLVQRHILNTAKLNSPYKIIAADVDGNKIVNSIDILRMKRLILGTDTTFTSTTKGPRLWEFIDSAYHFPDTTNPFPFKDSSAFANLTTTKVNQTFIGVKLGDVNYDWNAAVARSVAVNSLQLQVSTEKRSATIKQHFSTINFKNLAAMQYTLHFDNTKYEFIGIENNKLNLDFNSNKANTTGNIAMLWTDKNAEAKTLEDGTELFTLILRPLSSFDSRLLTFDVSLTNDIAAIEAFDNNFNKHNITLTQKILTKNQELEIKDQLIVYPNPAHTTINVEFKKIQSFGKLLVTNYSGNLVKEQTLFKGINKVDVSHLAKGVYTITVLTEFDKQTQKIVVE